jgi:hypothetical protein
MARATPPESGHRLIALAVRSQAATAVCRCARCRLRKIPESRQHRRQPQSDQAVNGRASRSAGSGRNAHPRQFPRRNQQRDHRVVPSRRPAPAVRQHRKRVDLPAPLGPMTATKSPAPGTDADVIEHHPTQRRTRNDCGKPGHGATTCLSESQHQ